MNRVDLSKFTEKHIKYIANAIKSYISTAEGAVRSGKTVDNCMAAALLIEASEDRFHLATGSTVANAKLNIGDCNGFGLQHLFGGRCTWGKYLGNDCLRIKTSNGEKIVIFAGGGKRNSFTKILGNSYGTWIATEINNHFISDDRDCFIDVAMSRLIASKEPHILWDLNPGNPNEEIYTKYIDVYFKKQKDGVFSGGYNYDSFTLDDNGSLNDNQKEKTKSAWDDGSVNYRRNILGLRVQAEGLIFRNFADNPDKYILNKLEIDDKPISFSMFNVGVDFGGNGSKTVFTNTGYVGYKMLIPVDDYKMEGGKGRISPVELEREFIEFLKTQYDKFKKYPKVAYCDSAEQVLINGLSKAVKQAKIPTKVVDCDKDTINGRIDFQMRMLNTARMFIYKDCKNIIGSLKSQVWDKEKSTTNKDVRLDDGITADIDTADAYEYSFSSYINHFIFK